VTVRPLVYIAGPYSADPVAGTRRAIGAGIALWQTGLVTPLIPHLSLLADLVHPMPVDEWYRYDLELLDRCDALLRLPGDSIGADLEARHAARRDLIVFHAFDDVVNWARTREIDLEMRRHDRRAGVA
jgi:hypothetical protein